MPFFLFVLVSDCTHFFYFSVLWRSYPSLKTVRSIGLKTLTLLLALAYSCAILQGRKFKLRGIQKYIGRLEWKRAERRHSSFWIGLYGQLWDPRSGGSRDGFLPCNYCGID